MCLHDSVTVPCYECELEKEHKARIDAAGKLLHERLEAVAHWASANSSLLYDALFTQGNDGYDAAQELRDLLAAWTQAGVEVVNAIGSHR